MYQIIIGFINFDLLIINLIIILKKVLSLQNLRKI